MSLSSTTAKIIPQSRAERTPEAVAVSGNGHGAGDHTPALSLLCPSPGQTLGRRGEAPGPSLDRQCITQQDQSQIEWCQNGSGWLRGTCQHGEERWVKVVCKRRDCPVCGPRRRKLIAWRIALGIHELAPAAWFVGTFAQDITKGAAVRAQGKFIRWLRQELGAQVQYACTWELTRSGRLHLNLILAPWRYVPQKRLSGAWKRFGGGPVVWVKAVGAEVGVEAAKSREDIGGYLGKLEQMVKEGRGVSYSKGWPKLPQNPVAGRAGKISWVWVGELSNEHTMFEYELDFGDWVEVAPGEYRSSQGESCSCFDRVPPGSAGLDDVMKVWYRIRNETFN